jgi:DNA-binding response OmpR family regulator
MFLPQIKADWRKKGRFSEAFMLAEDVSGRRVLLLARKGSSTQILRSVFHLAGFSKLVSVAEPRYAIELLCSGRFDALFIEGSQMHEGVPFALAARRHPGLVNPMIAMFAVFLQARRRDVETARDLGVHDVICRPVSPRTVIAKLRSVLAASRPFIAAPGFFGPDRRSKLRMDGRYFGYERRSRIAKKTRLPIGPGPGAQG